MITKRDIMEANFSLQDLYELIERVDELEEAIMSNCYDDPSTSGKRLMALALKEKGDEAK